MRGLERPPGRRRWLKFGAPVLVLAAAWLAFGSGPRPGVEIRPELPGIGRATPVEIVFTEPRRGLGELRVDLVQEGVEVPLAERRHAARPAWRFWGPRIERDAIAVLVGSDTIAGLRPGTATIRARAWPAPALLRRPGPVVAEVSLPVRLVPPALETVSRGHYPAQGGSGVVVYRVGDSAVRDGVAAGEWWFPGEPLPGSGGALRFALFGVPFDLEDSADLLLVAEDDVGNRAERRFVDRLAPRTFKRSRITIDDSFLERVLPGILAHTPEVEDLGDPVANFLQINRDLRRDNAQVLRSLAGASQGAFVWSEPFLALPGSKVMSSFADRRTYVYGGREIDRQDHLGYDLASVRRAEIPAANDGVVVLARYLGIYGNAVVIDHGAGLASLYGHLSSLAVQEGQKVSRGEVLGRSGETGLAGGDHLHFTLLVRGLPVDPLEWWDRRWIRDRVAAKLAAAASQTP